MSDDQVKIEEQRQMILDARQKGTGAKLWAYTKLSGPGWLQSAITLGGGSLSGSLYLGILAGFSLMWLQPLAMIMGVIMLSAIGYVALSTKERPFDAVRRHVNPALGWGWAIATMMANLVWCMPQFALGSAALQQNLAVGYFQGVESIGGLSAENSRDLITVFMLLIPASIVVWFYNSGGWGIRLFEIILKIMVGVVVISFFGVVLKMATSGAGLEWGQIFAGFIPDASVFYKPSSAFSDALSRSSDADYWTNLIMKDQRDVMITAAATAVGINMTFLLPYSMLQRGWDKDFRGLAMFDLSTGLFVPFLLATSCVVIASASQFHGHPAPGLLSDVDSNGNSVTAPAGIQSGFEKLIAGRLDHEVKTNDQIGSVEEAEAVMTEGDREIAAMLVRRDAFDLSKALEPLFAGTAVQEEVEEVTPRGKPIGNYLFGIGVLGMAVSTIIILMLINGFVFCEMLGLPSHGMAHRAGCLMAGLTGALGPFLWRGDAKFWLAVPTSVFGFMLLPIAYITFFCLMNSSSLLGENRPRGLRKLGWNLAMGVAAGLATFGSGWTLWSKLKSGPWSLSTNSGIEKVILLGLLSVLIVSIIVTHFTRKPVEDNPGN
ncbi:MAG: divalent metal cation transporter [Planctomycetaceae bacterium]|nr:divalent metal cation transporter [Planctomycetaceae bacterium]